MINDAGFQHMGRVAFGICARLSMLRYVEKFRQDVCQESLFLKFVLKKTLLNVFLEKHQRFLNESGSVFAYTLMLGQ